MKIQERNTRDALQMQEPVRSSSLCSNAGLQSRTSWRFLNTSLQKGTGLWVLFLFAVLYQAEAQNIWSKTYIADRPTMLFSSIEQTDSAYIVTGVVTGSPNNLGKSMAGQINSLGALVFYLAIEDSINSRNGLFWNSMLQTVNGKFAFVGYCYDTMSSVLFGLADKNLDSVSIFKYYTPHTAAFQGYSLLNCENGAYYITGVRTTDSVVNNANIFLMKVDSSGQRIWERYYNQDKVDFAKKVILLANGNLMLGAVRHDINNTNEQANTWLLEVDTGGQVIRQWFDPNDSTYAAEGLLQTADGGFVYAAQKKNYQSGSSSVSFNATIVKLDSNFIKQWMFSRGGLDLSIYTSINDIEELPDSSFVVAGNIAYYGVDTALNGYVARLNSNGGAMWERTYRGISNSQTLNFLTDIDVSPDGSLIAVGQCQWSGHTPSQVGWFLKLDSNGCEIENCLVGIDEFENENKQVVVYPQPATDKVVVNLNALQNIDEVAVFDLQGRELWRKTLGIQSSTVEIETSALANGVYILQLKNRTGVVVSVKCIVAR